VEIGTPVLVPEMKPASGSSPWGCRLRITGLPTNFDRGIFGIDGVQALALALELAGSLVASLVRSSKGRIELWDEPVADVFELFLPLPLTSMQSEVDQMRRYLKRAKTGRAVPAEWRDGVLIELANAAADLTALSGRERSAERVRSSRDPRLNPLLKIDAALDAP
jgi:hypothetical protein